MFITQRTRRRRTFTTHRVYRVYSLAHWRFSVWQCSRSIFFCCEWVNEWRRFNLLLLLLYYFILLFSRGTMNERPVHGMIVFIFVFVSCYLSSYIFIWFVIFYLCRWYANVCCICFMCCWIAAGRFTFAVMFMKKCIFCLVTLSVQLKCRWRRRREHPMTTSILF